MRPIIILLAVVAGLALMVAVSSSWITSPSRSSKSAAVDPHGLMLKTKDLPVDEIPSP